MNNGRLAFFNPVKEMRAAQKEYFSTRTALRSGQVKGFGETC